MAELLPENGVTIEVVHGRRTHFKITPPENLETSLRNDIAKALGDHQKLSAEQQKLRPMTVEIAGQMELIDPEKLLGIRPGSYERGYGGAF